MNGDNTVKTVALSDGYWGSLGHGVGAIVSYAVLGLVLVMLGFAVLDLTTPGTLRRLVRDGKPNAVAVSASGILAVALIVVFAIYSANGRLAEGLIAATAYGLTGIVALMIAGRIAEQVLGVDVGELLAAETLRPQAWAVAVTHLALGLVIAVSIL